MFLPVTMVTKYEVVTSIMFYSMYQLICGNAKSVNKNRRLYPQHKYVNSMFALKWKVYNLTIIIMMIIIHFIELYT